MVKFRLKKYLYLSIICFIFGGLILYWITTMQPYAVVPPDVEVTVTMLTFLSAVMFITGGLLVWYVCVQSRWKGER